MRKTATTTLAALALVAAAAPAADASTVSFDANGTLVVSAGPERNRLGLQSSAWEDGRIVVYDAVPGTTVTSTAAACEQWGEDSVICGWDPAAGARMDLGDGDDDGYVSSALPAGAPFAIAGGPGHDKLESSLDGQPTTLDGGPGDDTLNGGTGVDTLIGGDGADALSGGAGGDRLDAGAGDDLLAGDGSKGKHADTIDGGAGYDRIELDWSDGAYDAPDENVNVSLAGGNDDGRPGEGDDVRGVEKVVSYSAGRLVGGDAAEHLEVFQITGAAELIGNGGNDTLKGADGADRLDGGAGDDDLDAGFGDDTIVGGPGADNIAGDRRSGDCGPLWCKHPYGNDTIDARDGVRDSITCGAGQDSVQADPVDVVAADCETVTRDSSGPGPNKPGTPGKGALAASITRTKLARALAHGLKLRMTAPAAGRVSATAKLAGKPVASGSRKVKRAGKTTVVLRFTKRARRQLRRAGGAKLAVAIRFAPRRGAAVRQRLAVELKRR
jgi:hypothetical protein